MATPKFNTLKKRLAGDLKLAGYRKRTRDTYLERVCSLANYYDQCPSKLSDEQIRDYLLYIVDERHYSPSSLRIANAALKFFYKVTLKRDVKLLDTVKAESRDKLPDIFSVEDAWRIIHTTRSTHHKACFAVLYTCGLRIHEALNLTINDIDTPRMQIRIRAGKGGKDRAVPMSSWTLQTLRKQWATHRNPSLIFPAIGTTQNLASIAKKPMCANAPRNTLRAVVEELNVKIPQVRLHAFRHSYATHLLDAGVNICSLKEYLGHSSLSSTMVYLHLTKHGHERACLIIETIMGGK